jgi:hypothetical protein
MIGPFLVIFFATTSLIGPFLVIHFETTYLIGLSWSSTRAHPSNGPSNGFAPIKIIKSKQ